MLILNMPIIVFVLAAFLLGSIPSGVLLARAMGLGDPREFGSGNIGASNLTRLGGKKLGALTFLCDFLKGLIPPLCVILFFPDAPGLAAAAGFASVFGHCYSIFLKFDGGKGVATTAGALMILSPVATLIGLCIWAFIFYLERISSLAAMVALLAIIISLGALQADKTTMLAATACCLVVIRRHDTNLVSLLNSVERKF